MVKTEIEIGSEVSAVDRRYGNAICLVLDPVHEKLTHIVVQETDFPYTQRLVPMQAIRSASPGRIELKTTTDDLKKMETFVETEFIPSEDRNTVLVLWPYVVPEEVPVITLEHQKVPPGEIAVRRGTAVHAMDGPIGRVDELMIDAQDGNITHLVMREGHLWGRKDISIPISQIEKLDSDTVFLKLSKKEVEALPQIQIRRGHA